MSAAANKADVGFRKPTERDRCATCRHSGHADNGRDGPWARSWLNCKKHHFASVQGGAICDHFEPSPSVSRPPPAVTDVVIGDLFDTPPAET
jgi:hypothetical protein